MIEIELKTNKNNTTKCYYIKGTNVLHRGDGPAVEYASGGKYWFINGKMHREDGPAAEFGDGGKEWFVEDKYIKCKSQEEFERILKLKVFI